MNITELQWQKILMKTMYVGLAMNVLAPVGIFVAALALKGNIADPAGGVSVGGQGTLEILFYALLVISALDFGMTWYIRRNFIRAMAKDIGEMSVEAFERRTMTLAFIVFALNASYAIYGLILHLMGAQIEILLLFVALSLVGYQVFRPREGLLKQVQGTAHLPSR